MDKMNNDNAGDGLELKWWEKKKGITLEYKKKKIQGKQDRKARREQERLARERGELPDEVTEEGPHKGKSRPNKRRRDSERRNAERGNYQEKAFLASDRGNLFSVSALDDDAVRAMADFEKIVSSVYPLTSKQRALLPAQIRSLSHELTDEREDRRMGYMNETTALSAYIHYYLWWNIVRLSRVFSNLPGSYFNLKDGSV
ncbi:MAG: hypothetical protein IJL80_09965, partial [Treponema sp.]|nr:hypothetical protein [Treponema sp.]